jgi:hypothetical protein
MNEQQKEQQARRGLFQAGTALTWVLVAVIGMPVLGCGLCCIFSIIGSAADRAAQ